MSKIEKISNILIAAGTTLGLTSVFLNSFFYTVDAGIIFIFKVKEQFYLTKLLEV